MSNSPDTDIKKYDGPFPQIQQGPQKPIVPPSPKKTVVPSAPQNPIPPIPKSGLPMTPAIPEAGYIPRASGSPSVAPVETTNDTDSKFRELVSSGKGLVDAINQNYDYQLKQARAASAGASAAAGLGGSTANESATKAALEPVLKQREQDLQTAYQTIDTKNRANASDAIKALAANHLDWNQYKTTNPKNYQNLVDTFGGDPNIVDAMFATSVPKQDVQQTWVNGSTYNQLVTDPVTGKPSVQSYDLGVQIPQNWVSEKIGTNAVVYHGANWDPHDPSTYQIFGVDPLTGLPTGQIGGSENPSAPVPPNTITGAVSTVASTAGIADPIMSLADAISTNGIGGIVAGIIKNEGSSPSGVINNPGNIKYAGLPGQADSGIKATDGGTFASYPSMDAGQRAIADLVMKGANDPSQTFAGFINKYTGQTQGGQSQSDTANLPGQTGSILSAAGVSLPVFNYLTQGTSSLARLSAPQRNAIINQASDWLNKNGIDISTFQSRYQALNQTLQGNVQRTNAAQIQENELLGTIDNLQETIKDADLGKLKVKNVAEILAGKQTNDPIATKYATYLLSLKNELAGYNAAARGNLSSSGGPSPDQQDNDEAGQVIQNGIASGSLSGFKEAITAQQKKMGAILNNSVSAANKSVWDLFGVGGKYKAPNSSNENTDDKSFVEKTLNDHGMKYEDVLAKYIPSLKNGEKLAIDRKTGSVTAVTSSDDPSTYVLL